MNELQDYVGGKVVFGISNTPSIQPEQVEDCIENGHQLIDVREDDEWQAGHHSNANHIKMGEIPSNLDAFDKEKKYIIVCRSGGRSAKVTDFLVENEIDALNLTGGMKKFSQVSTNVRDSLGNTGQII